MQQMNMRPQKPSYGMQQMNQMPSFGGLDASAQYQMQSMASMGRPEAMGGVFGGAGVMGAGAFRALA